MADIAYLRGAVRPARAPAIVRVPAQDEIVFENTVWPYRLALSFMLLLAVYAHLKQVLCDMVGKKRRYNVYFGDGLSVNGAKVRDGQARWPALHAIYNFRIAQGETKFRRRIDSWWMHIRNAQAVRNRLKIAKRELIAAITSLAAMQDSVFILSLASGSAQSVIEAIAECVKAGIDVRALLLDQDATALAYAKVLAARYGVADRLATKECNVMHFERHVVEEPDIIEMMGFIDYWSDAVVKKVISRVWDHLKPGGYFFTCHIHRNGEAYFMRHVISWDPRMRYRSAEHLRDLMAEGEFLTPQLIPEPHGIHTIAIGRK